MNIMSDIVTVIIANLEKVSMGIVLFLSVYLANMGLGAWRSVKLEGYNFDWKMIIASAIKFAVLGVSLALLTASISLIPYYATYVGIEIEAEALKVLDSLIIIGAFLTATIQYAKDAVEKLVIILKA